MQENSISQDRISVMVDVEPRVLRELLQLALRRAPRFFEVEAPDRNRHQSARDGPKTADKDEVSARAKALDWLIVSLDKHGEIGAHSRRRLETFQPAALLALGNEGDYAEVWAKVGQSWTCKFTVKAISLTVAFAILHYKGGKLPSAISLGKLPALSADLNSASHLLQ